MLSRSYVRAAQLHSFFKVKHYSTVRIDHTVSTQFYVRGHLDGLYAVDTAKATAVNTGDKLRPNSLKFNEQKRYLSIC